MKNVNKLLLTSSMSLVAAVYLQAVGYTCNTIAPNTYLVDNNDSVYGDNSLHACINKANNDGNNSTIVFDSDMKISLGCGGSINETKSLTIDGGEHNITIDSSYITSDSSSGNVTFKNLNIKSSYIDFRSPALVENCSISDAHTLAIISNSDLNISNSSFTLNQGSHGTVYMTSGGNLVVKNSTFESNTAPSGGAIYASEATIAISNSTFSNNSASQYGGAIYAVSSKIDINSSTIVQNSAGQYGAIFVESTEPLKIANSIITNNITTNSNTTNQAPALRSITRDFPMMNIPTSLGNNLFSTDINDSIIGGITLQNTDILSDEPKLNALADNGGETKTMALQVGSPAINAGATTLTTDQRGVKRDSKPDIGAYEYVAPVVVVTPTPTPTPEPEVNQLVDSDADELDTGLTKGKAEESDEDFTLKFQSEDGNTTEIIVPKVEGKTIFLRESSQATEFEMDNGIASYNNNGTTEHSISVDGKNTQAVSYIPGAKVEFTQTGGVQTSVESSGSDILIVATATGESQNSVTNPNGVSTKADSNILGTQTEIQANGKVVVDTPSVLSNLGNEITTKTTLDADGNAVLSATKTLPDGTIEEVALGGYGEGSQVVIKEVDGAVVVEVITTLGTESFTLRNGRR